MGFLHCCGGLKRSTTFTLIPEDGYLYAELDLLEECPVCGHFVLQLTRINLKHEVSIVRKKNIAARKLYDKLKYVILFKQEYKFSPLKSSGSNFYLNYNEYGTKKRCYSNLSTLKMGLSEPMQGLYMTNPIKLSLKKEQQVCDVLKNINVK